MEIDKEKLAFYLEDMDYDEMECFLDENNIDEIEDEDAVWTLIQTAKVIIP